MSDRAERIELPGYTIDLFVPQGSSRLVLLFPPMGIRPGSPDLAWGARFVRGLGMGALCVTARRNDWYRGADLLDWFGAGGFAAISREFDTHSFYGVSMGGYAACAFSAIVPGSTVLAYAPQSTLSPELVPWDRRYPEGSRQDWSGPWGDAATSIVDAGQAVLVFDPFARNDRRHAMRLAGPRTQMVLAPFLGHHAAVRLARLGAVKTIFRSLHAQPPALHELAALMRCRKEDPSYLTSIARAPRTPWQIGLAAVTKAARFAPGTVEVVLAEAEVRFRAGDFDRAARLAQSIADRKDEKQRNRHDAEIMMARCTDAMGDTKAAIAMLRGLLARQEDYRARMVLRQLISSAPRKASSAQVSGNHNDALPAARKAENENLRPVRIESVPDLALESVSDKNL